MLISTLLSWSKLTLIELKCWFGRFLLFIHRCTLKQHFSPVLVRLILTLTSDMYKNRAKKRPILQLSNKIKIIVKERIVECHTCFAEKHIWLLALHIFNLVLLFYCPNETLRTYGN